MTQSQIDRAVARATGEPVGVIQRRGFSLHGLPVPPRRRRRRRPHRSSVVLSRQAQSACA